jgi:serine/threonine-protein kinase
MIGRTIGPYAVVAKLGAGGMGEVYRARDTKLDRDVALKILPESFASDPDRLMRFEREAKTLASLNHPHIAQIHGFEQSGGTSALVMELVEGEDLSQRIARGPVPIDEALPIARQIAEALEAAHEQGIIHRDLKPANIKIRTDGTVKVLDFGLAKAIEQGSGIGDQGSGGRAFSPTITSPAMTQAGVILGTAAYMAPEQARGKAVDRRADIWAFGCVLYEMLCGRRAFRGDDLTETLTAIMRDTPDLAALPATTPSTIKQMVARCLEKDHRLRLRDIGEARVELSRIHDQDARTVPVIPAAGSGTPSVIGRVVPWSVAALCAAAAITVLILWAQWRPAQASMPRKLLTSIGVDASMPTDLGTSAILSPDGSMLAVAAQQGAVRRLYVRKLDQLDATVLVGTEFAQSPFFSPDGQWLAFFSLDKLMRVSVAGGAAVTVCNAPIGRGGTWADDDTIIFSPNSGTNTALMRVAAAGGTATPLTTLSEGATTQRWPQALPRGKGVLFSEHTSQVNWDGGTIVVAPLSGGQPKVVLQGGYYGRYVSDASGGYLLYMQQAVLFAIRFDLDRLETVGQAMPVMENIAANPATTGGAQVAVSEEGTLLYIPGRATTMANPIDWIARDGTISPLRTTRSIWLNPQFSPDGQKLAVQINDGKQTDIWVYEWARETITQLTFDPGRDDYPVWTPDGKRIAFASDRAQPGVFNLYWVNADGTGDAGRLSDSPGHQVPSSWHPSGKFLAFNAVANPAEASVSPVRAQADLMILPMDGDISGGGTPGRPIPFLKDNAPAAEVNPKFSPDGRWIAYASSESGMFEVYVRPFPGPGGRWRVSTGGGLFPSWSAKTQELLFLEVSIAPRVMFAPYTVMGDSFRADAPRVWSPAAIRGITPANFTYAPHPDGTRAAALPSGDQGGGQDKVVFVFNFLEHLRSTTARKQ